jgi:Protein NO VEIN, C-terminal
MASRYDEIANDRERLERTAKNSIRTLSALYADRTHFIFELIQNTEDALRRRPTGWTGSRAVIFELDEHCLRLDHWGEPFDEADVRAICSVGETTKSLTDIGHFGIGFKSVYAFTDRPEVHSGREDFAIEDFVRPIPIASIQRDSDETVILVPRKPSDDSFSSEIRVGLQRLGAGTLLFLREIEEIEWRVEDGPAGLYLRSKPEELDDGVRRITVIGQEQGKPELDETWLVFSRVVTEAGGGHIGHVEVAFSITDSEKSERESIQRVAYSPLVVFFPTVVETHMGFLLQGPYRTTPSRDNVPHRDAWNQHCVNETAIVLLEALRWLRDQDLLDAGVLRCLPLDRSNFSECSMFAPIFDATQQALATEPLLPRHGGGHVAATEVRLARTDDLRELFGPSQLTGLLQADSELAWVSGDISEDRTPELRKYLISELGVEELRPETILAQLDTAFLQTQSDDWVRRLYEFLSSLKALHAKAKEQPLIRLIDGRHVRPESNGKPQAFLPGGIETRFPTVRATVCCSEDARAFLRGLGLTEPDPVDDVIWNILPKYTERLLSIASEAYEADIRGILTAFQTDSDNQRKKLLKALSDTTFVRAADQGDGAGKMARPGDVYLATERLSELFKGVQGIWLVDNNLSCLRGEEVRNLFEACGAVRYLRPVSVKTTFTWNQLREMRTTAGCESISSSWPLEDYTLYGLEMVLKHLSVLDADARKTRAAVLWDALCELEERRGAAVFSGTYRWNYHRTWSTTFDAAFLRLVNETAWVPDGIGLLQRPDLILFANLGWKPNPFLQSKIRFKPPIIETLAREAGIEAGVLDLLKKLGLTNEADLRAKLAKAGIVESEQQSSTNSLDDAIKNIGVDEPTLPIEDPTGPEPTPSGNRGTGSGRGAGAGATSSGGQGARSNGVGGGEGQTKGSGEGSTKRAPGSSGGRPFISYVAAHPEEDEPDPDGLDQQARMALEAKAIEFILSREPKWQRTLTHNPGYDLYQANDSGHAREWCEVKAMTGTLHNRAVGLSRTQFMCAQEHGESYWLYIVEQAGTENARLVRIQHPAGKARTFTFDRGWLSVADGREEQKD